MRHRQAVADPKDLAGILTEIEQAEIVSMDTETTGLEVFAADFELVGLVVNTCVEGVHKGYYIPINHCGFEGLDYEPKNVPLIVAKDFVLKAFEILNRRGLRPKMHNAAYDQLVLFQTMDISIDDMPADDTVLAAHLLNENHPLELKELARSYLGVQEEKAKVPKSCEKWFEENLLTKHKMPSVAASGRKSHKTMYELVPDWLERYVDYFKSLHDGAVSFGFVMDLHKKLMGVLKKRGIVEFDGQFPTNFKYIPIEIATLYAVDDGTNTLELWSLLERTLFDAYPKLKMLYTDIEREVQHIMTKATAKGILVDEESLMQAKALMQDRIDEFTIEALQLATKIVEEINPAVEIDLSYERNFLNSHEQLRAFLFDVLEFRPTKFTASGAASTAKDVLESLLTDEPAHEQCIDDARRFLELKLRIGALQKLRNTYTDSLLDRLDGFNRLHASFNIAGTVSGRMSSSKPNLQNIPRLTPAEQEEKPYLEGIDIRKAFVADPDYCFVCADYDAMEMVGTAALSGDENLKKLLAEKRDLHAFTARYTFKVGEELDDNEFKKRFPLERQKAKIVNFLMVYGGNVWTIMNRLGVEREEAEMLYNGYFEAFPGVKAWMDKVYQELEEYGQITYPIYGYIKRMDLPPTYLQWKDPKNYQRQYQAALRTCQNALIQGLCAFIVKQAIVDMTRGFREAGLDDDDAMVILQVHDEIIVRARTKHAPRVAKIMSECMNRDLMGVALEATPEIKFDLSKASKAYSIEEFSQNLAA